MRQEPPTPSVPLDCMVSTVECADKKKENNGEKRDENDNNLALFVVAAAPGPNSVATRLGMVRKSDRDYPQTVNFEDLGPRSVTIPNLSSRCSHVDEGAF